MERNYGDQMRPQGQRRPQQGAQRRRPQQGRRPQQQRRRSYDDYGRYDDSYATIDSGGQSRAPMRPSYERESTRQGYDPRARQRTPQRQSDYPTQRAPRPQGRRPSQSQAAQRQSVVLPSGSTRIPITGGNPYSTTSGLPNAPKKRSPVKPILLSLLAVLMIAGVAFGFLTFMKPKVSVTVNGKEISMPKDSTLDDAKKELGIEVTPGKLLAVDGSVIDEKGGSTQTVVVNGKELSESDYQSFKFTANGTTVEFSDGKDEEETFTTSEETEPHAGGHEIESTANDYWTGAVHRYQHGQDGIKTTKRGAVSGIEITEETQPKQDEEFFIYSVDTGGDKVIALTFDDGPWDETTDEILDVLEENGAKATFFTIGNQIAEHASQIRREQELGCQVCTHSWDHAAGSGQGVNLTYMTGDEQIQEIQKGYDAIKEVLGSDPSHVIRAPGGNFYGSIVNTLAPYVDAEIGWDVDTEDWRKPGSDSIYNTIMSATPGQIVLMHDGGGDRSQTVAAVRRAVPELVAKGYRLVTVNELLEYGVPSIARRM